MLQFKYKKDKSTHIGTIALRTRSLPIEAEIEADGWTFHIIVGKHANGNYICIPNWSIGSELAALNDRLWNNERLESCTKLGETNSGIIADALVELSHFV